MDILAATTWQDVALALIAALPGLIAAIFGALNHRNMRTPSGSSIGYVAERAHDLAAVAAMRPELQLNGTLEHGGQLGAPKNPPPPV